MEKILNGATEIRENVERDPSLGRKHGLYDELRSLGLTDYVAWPMYHTLGKRHIVTFATDRPGGFRRSAYCEPIETAANFGAGQRNPHEKPAGANAARNLCRVACRRAHPGWCHQARKRDDGTRRHYELLTSGNIVTINVFEAFNAKPVSTKGYVGAVLIAGGSVRETVTLAPQGENSLKGEAKNPIPAGATITLTIKTAEGEVGPGKIREIVR